MALSLDFLTLSLLIAAALVFLVVGALALAICAVALRAILSVDLFAVLIVGRQGRFFQLGVAATCHRHANWRALGQPQEIGLQRGDDLVTGG